MAAKSRPYHHGDLRASLLDAALSITRASGPAALSLREVTRTVGVSPTAAYRHFGDRSQLLRAVADEIQDRMAARMRRRMRAPVDAPADQRAVQRLRGVGLGYVAFAVGDPGWFETAFFGVAGPPVPDAAEERVPPPFALLTAALDELVAADVLTPARRAGAEFVCWSAVHGCAELMIHGPLRDADRATKRAITERVVDDIITGIR